MWIQGRVWSRLTFLFDFTGFQRQNCERDTYLNLTEDVERFALTKSLIEFLSACSVWSVQEMRTYLVRGICIDGIQVGGTRVVHFHPRQESRTERLGSRCCWIFFLWCLWLQWRVGSRLTRSFFNIIDVSETNEGRTPGIGHRRRIWIVFVAGRCIDGKKVVCLYMYMQYKVQRIISSPTFYVALHVCHLSLVPLSGKKVTSPFYMHCTWLYHLIAPPLCLVFRRPPRTPWKRLSNC